MNKNDFLTTLLTSLLLENADALLPVAWDLAQQHPFLALISGIWVFKQFQKKKTNDKKDETLD
ncbi:hypothetical protein BC30090_p315 (plasmid) [Bacillus cereus]|uniref:hypothetical protein n=1 Tax=Bacillus TaxID=1386 RepID=UPI001BB440C3|nr:MULTISPECIES: hypothetical protein [Bacillus]BCC80221.1 hypothetical protein BCJMU62_p230 [Bacillus cereus]BCD26891.1 hypothetical protein BC30090_p315 [Bacillus cereus]GMB79186.1 hypothetical protein BCER1_55870 [Bacillus cereus]